MSTESFVTSAPKRRRIITTCVACYRRKQKCDRKHPCNICRQRGVECKFLDGEKSQSIEQPQSSLLNQLSATSKKRQREDSPVLDVLPPTDLSSQTGYSTHHENTLSNLQRVYLRHGLTNASSQKSLLRAYIRDRYFSLTELLPKDPLLEELLLVFFQNSNSHVGVLEQYFFEKSFRAWQLLKEKSQNEIHPEEIPRDLLFFPAVLFQVLAVALQYVTLECRAADLLQASEWSDIDNASSKYTRQGMELMKLLGRHNPTITSVQHDLMRSFWLKNASRGTESWFNLGDAIRMAMDLGLHLKSAVLEGRTIEETVENVWLDELRKRLWVSLFNWDAHLALVLGRARSINVSDCTVEAPVDCNMPISQPTTVPSMLAMCGEPSCYTRHLFNNFICHKTHEMLSLGANRSYVKDYGTVRRLANDVLAKLKELPPVARPNNTDYSWDSRMPYLPKQREHILTFANSFLVALHRPHAASHNESLVAAINASVNVLESQERLFRVLSNKFYGTFSAPFFTIDAALFLSTTVLENPDLDADLKDRIDAAVGQAIARLKIMRHRNPMAANGAALLEQCVSLQRERVSSSSDSGYLSSQSSTSLTPALHSTNTLATCGNEEIPGARLDQPTYHGEIDQSLLDSVDLIGNMTDFNSAFWTDQMSQIVNASDLSEDDFSWAFLPR